MLPGAQNGQQAVWAWGLVGGLTFRHKVVPGAALGSDALCRRGLSSGVPTAPAPTASVATQLPTELAAGRSASVSKLSSR